VSLLVPLQTNNRKVVGSRPTKVVCITVLTGNRLGWTVRCDRPPLRPILPSCRKLEFRLSALMDSDLAWVNGKNGRQSWCYADAFQRCILSGAVYHFIVTHFYFSSECTFSTSCSFSCSWHHSSIVSLRLRHHHIIPPVSLSTLPLVSNFLIVTIYSVISSSSSAACALHALRIELNPGSSNLTVCTLNICSILHTFHSAVLSDLLDLRKPFRNLD